MNNDQYIWEEFKAGKEYALSHIYNQNIDFLFSYGKKFTLDEALVLDVIQDLFYDLIRTKKNLGKTDNIRLYLVTSFRRKLIRELQSINNRPIKDQEVEILPIISFSVEDDYILSEERSQRHELIQQGFKELNHKQREVLYYKFTLGLNYKQISEIMTITNDNSRQLVSRSIQILKKYLAEKNLILLFINYKLKKK